MTEVAREAGITRLEMYIDGAWSQAQSGQTFQSVDPFTGEPWAELPVASEADVDRAVAAARRAFDEGPWGRSTPQERAALLRRLAELIEANQERLSYMEVRDNGKLLREMSGQVINLRNHYEWFAGAAERIAGEVLSSAKSTYTVLQLHEPVGVVGAITPWNSPLMLLSWKLAAAIAAGCTFVAKPASQAPGSTIGLAQLFDEAGFPPGVFNVVTGPGSTTGQALVAHRGVDKVAFTGSAETGILVATAAAGHLAAASMELGGKSPNIVFADADLDAAANGVIAGIFAAGGQTCVAGSRLLVQRSVHDELVDRVVARARTIALGDPMLAETEMGPMAFKEQQEKVLGYIEIARAEGATVATGGGLRPGLDGGLFVEPTVLVDVDNAMRVAREEIFGPVLSVIPFDDEEDAVRIANDTEHGLAAGLWTRDVMRVHRMIRRIRAGTIWVNAYRVVNYDVPFGGVKRSGYGRENGMEGLRAYLVTKSVWIELTGESRDPFKLG
jgi:aldehyde dehydrogenase (NAD+)